MATSPLQWTPVADAAWKTSGTRFAEPRSRVPRRREMLIGLALAGLATALQLALARSLAGMATTGGTRPILVAAHELRKGDLLERDDVSLVEVDGAHPLLSEKTESRLLIGKRIAVDLPKGHPISVSLVSEPFDENSLAQNIPVGKRLFMLDADLGGMGGALKRGDRVDVFGELRLPEKGLVTRALLSNVPVVAVGGLAPDAEGSRESRVAFYLESSEISFLTQARRYGKFSVALRNPSDNETALPEDGMTQTQFLNDSRIEKVFGRDGFRIRRGRE